MSEDWRPKTFIKVKNFFDITLVVVHHPDLSSTLFSFFFEKKGNGKSTELTDP